MLIRFIIILKMHWFHNSFNTNHSLLMMAGRHFYVGISNRTYHEGTD